jgi:hypothetical protein
MSQTPDTPAPLGCMLFFVFGMPVAVLGLAYLGSEQYKATHEYDWWIIGLFVITGLYLVAHSRYLLLFPSPNDSPERSTFIIGRMLCFLTFPHFAYLIALAVWYFAKSSSSAAIAGLVGGWLISKALRATLFASEYAYRDRQVGKKYTRDLAGYELRSDRCATKCPLCDQLVEVPSGTLTGGIETHCRLCGAVVTMVRHGNRLTVEAT